MCWRPKVVWKLQYVNGTVKFPGGALKLLGLKQQPLQYESNVDILAYIDVFYHDMAERIDFF